MTRTNKQRKLLAVCPKITGGLSMIGSSLTIREIFKDPSKRSKPQFRILVGMSICDMFSSFGYFMSTWAIPKDSDNSFARGNDLTCNVQGFLIQFGVAIPLYNCMLCIFHLLTIKHGWKEDQVRSVEKLFHFTPLGFAAATSVTIAANGNYGDAMLWCWITTNRKNVTHLLRWTTFYGPLWAAILTATGTMIAVFHAVRRSENKSMRWSFPPPLEEISTENNAAQFERKNTSNQRPVAVQATFFLLAFLITWSPSSLVRLIQMIGYQPSFFLKLCMAIILPCQGALNFLVYNRPKWLIYRRQNPQQPILNAITSFLMILVRGRSITGTRQSITETRPTLEQQNISCTILDLKKSPDVDLVALETQCQKVAENEDK